jgi:hypothetical protein
MPMFTSFEALNAYIKKTVLESMEIVNQEVRTLLIEHIQKYYNEYNPKVYDRSYDLLNYASIALKPEMVGNQIVCQVYLEPSQLRQDGYHHQLDPHKIVELASQGYHGTTDIQTDERFIENTVKELMQDKKHLKILSDRLQSKGFNVTF